MRACSFQKGVRADWQLLELWGLCLCLQLSQVPQGSGETGMCVYVCMSTCICECARGASVHASMKSLQCMNSYCRCHGVTSHLHWLPEGTAVRQAIFAEGTQVTSTPVINDIALSSTPV